MKKSKSGKNPLDAAKGHEAGLTGGGISKTKKAVKEKIDCRGVSMQIPTVVLDRIQDWAAFNGTNLTQLTIDLYVRFLKGKEVPSQRKKTNLRAKIAPLTEQKAARS